VPWQPRGQLAAELVLAGESDVPAIDRANCCKDLAISPIEPPVPSTFTRRPRTGAVRHDCFHSLADQSTALFTFLTVFPARYAMHALAFSVSSHFWTRTQAVGKALPVAWRVRAIDALYLHRFCVSSTLELVLKRVCPLAIHARERVGLAPRQYGFFIASTIKPAVPGGDRTRSTSNRDR
jgi:hypothetical protein